jgi:hypothetical protein
MVDSMAGAEAIALIALGIIAIGGLGQLLIFALSKKGKRTNGE